MRSRTSNWFETTIRYDKTMEDGMQKKVSELYVVDALSFGEAEEAITREMSAYISGEFDVKNINPAAYGEVFFSDNANDDRWYKARVTFITIDEKTAVEKRTSANMLVQASDLKTAVANLEKGMAGTMGDWVLTSMAETPIIDVFPYKAPED